MGKADEASMQQTTCPFYWDEVSLKRKDLHIDTKLSFGVVL